MNTSNPISNYVVVGGGTAGWISAAVLARAYHNLPINITLVESPDISTIGVGEATIPSIMDLLEYLKIPAKEFMLKTNATFKLGIKFVDWFKTGHHYWHQFGHVGNKIDGKAFYQHWLKYQMIDPKFNFTDFSPAVALAEQNKFYIADPKKPNNLSNASYALHFDATLVANYLKNYCESLGVTHIAGKVNKVDTNLVGDISALELDDNRVIAGDFFFDCTGQRALLINKTLRVGFENWQHYLPVDKAIAVQTVKKSPLPPYTQAFAHQHGWRWQIPLQNRTGNGYVYCSDYCSDQQAIDLLSEQLGEFKTTPKMISFDTGKRNKIWFKNCLAVGLSAGFLEPLESTSIYLIMRTMLNFVQSIPDKNIPDVIVNNFNKKMDHEYQCIRDFIVLHYCTSQRKDSPFWRMWQHLDIPDSLHEKLAFFKYQGRLIKDNEDLFSEQSWYAVLAGMQVMPTQYDPLVEASDFVKITQAFTQSAQSLKSSAQQVLSHEAFIEKMQQY